MDLNVNKVDIWAAPIEDQSGALSDLLGSLRDADADLDFIIGRRIPGSTREGIVFVAPIEGDKQVYAAARLGFNVSESVHSVRIEGVNQEGIAAEISQALSEAGLNLRGMSAATLGDRFIMYVGLDSEVDADRAVTALGSWNGE